MARASRGAPVTVKCRCLKGIQLKGLQLLVYEALTHEALKKRRCLQGNKCRCLKGLQLLVYEASTHDEALTHPKAA